MKKYFRYKNTIKEMEYRDKKLRKIALKEKCKNYENWTAYDKILTYRECIEIIKNNIIERNEKTGFKYTDGKKIYENDIVEAVTEWNLGPGIIRGRVIKDSKGIFCIEGVIECCKKIFPLYDCYDFKKIK